MSTRSMNRVTLIGNLTRDPDLRYSDGGTPVCTIGIATNRAWKTADGKEHEDAQFHRVVAWSKLAELCAKLLFKGRKVLIEGRLQYRKFTNKDGVEQTVAEIIMNELMLLDSKKGAQADEVEQPDPAMEPQEDPNKVE